MWGDGAKLIPHPVSPFQNDLVSFSQMRSTSKSKQNNRKSKQTLTNHPSHSRALIRVCTHVLFGGLLALPHSSPPFFLRPLS